MFRYKTNKKMLIIAAAVILLCFVCLSGATLALFSQTLDGTIGIITTAGDIEVDIVDDSPEANSLQGKVLNFITTEDQQNILFEPGATFYTQGFKVKNVGDININFRVAVSEDDSIDMLKFNEAFEVRITTDPHNPAAADELTKFKGSLKKDCTSEYTYYLCVKMKESVGNEFQGKTYSGIGVTVYAVQGNVAIEE